MVRTSRKRPPPIRDPRPPIQTQNFPAESPMIRTSCKRPPLKKRTRLCFDLIVSCSLFLHFGKRTLDPWRVLFIRGLYYTTQSLRANVCNFRESVDICEFLNFFIFCPHNLYSTLISKITLKLVTAFYFFLNRAKFEKRQIGALSSMKLAKIKHFRHLFAG